MPDGITIEESRKRRQAKLLADAQMGQLVQARNAAAAAQNRAINARNAERTLMSQTGQSLPVVDQTRLAQQAVQKESLQRAVPPLMQQFNDVAEAQSRGMSVPSLMQERLAGDIANQQGQAGVAMTQAQAGQVAGQNDIRLAEAGLDFARGAFIAQTTADARRHAVDVEAGVDRDRFLSDQKIADATNLSQEKIAAIEASRPQGPIGQPVSAPTTPTIPQQATAPSIPDLAAGEVQRVEQLMFDPTVATPAIKSEAVRVGRDLLDARDEALRAGDSVMAAQIEHALERLRRFALGNLNTQLFDPGVLR